MHSQQQDTSPPRPAQPRNRFGQKIYTFLTQQTGVALWQSDSVVLTMLAIGIGILTGFGAVGFHFLLEGTHTLLHTIATDVVQRFSLDDLVWSERGMFILLPTIGSLVALGLIRLFAQNDQSHGTSAVIEAVALRGGWLPARPLLAKVLAAGIFIGAGGSAGPEDPSVQLGAVAGSQTGQTLRLSSQRVRTLVASGVAAAVAAAFNAPIAGVFFAFEIVVGTLSSALFPPVVLAAVAASAVSHWLRGNAPAFRVPPYEITNPLIELPTYAVLGIVTALVGVLFIRLLFRLEDLLAKLKPPKMLQGLLIGVTVGIVGLWVPEVLGVGYETIGKVLLGEVSGTDYFLLLLGVKLILTAVCLAGIGVGGTFAPSLYFGAMTGALVGIAAHRIFPDVSVAAYALVGMGGVLTAVVRAPITAVLLLFELTNDYRIILPIMLCVAASHLVAGHLFNESVYTERLARHGIVLRFGSDLNIMEMVRVDEAMTRKLDVLYTDTTIREAIDQLNETHHHGMPIIEQVLNGGKQTERLVGMVTLSDIARALKQGIDERKSVLSIATTNDLLVVYPDQSLNDALRMFAIRDVGRLPVVDRVNPQQMIGILRRPDVVRAYSTGMIRRSEMERRIRQMKIRSHSGAEVIELTVDRQSSLAGRTVRSLPLPTNCLLATVQRGLQAQLPRGNTVLQPGDRLTFLAVPEEVDRLEALCSTSQTERVDIDMSPRYHRLVIEPDAPAVGKAVETLNLGGALLVSVERAQHTLIPHGYTVIRAGDRLTLFAEPYDLPPALEELTGTTWS